MPRAERHRNKKSVFWRCYWAYLAFILVFLIAVFFYVRATMLEYERNSPENYVVWLAESASGSSELGSYLEKYNFSDNRYGDAKERKERFYSTVKAAKLEAKPAPGSHSSLAPVYEITADGKPFLNIAISETGSHTKLGIMSLSDWDIDHCIMRDPASSAMPKLSEDKNLDISLVMPSDFTLLTDGVQTALPEGATETALSDFEYIAKYVSAPKGVSFELSDLYFEPSLAALNNAGEELVFDVGANGVYSVKADYAASPEAKALAESVCDPLAIGKTWSRFMTDDVGGAHHGRDTVIKECRLLKGTGLYELALRWSSNVDISFVSGHSLDSWSNESETNYIQYNDELFSCDVYFEKNMTIKRGVGPRTDVFSNRMFFGKVNGGWYLLDMISLDK